MQARAAIAVILTICAPAAAPRSVDLDEHGLDRARRALDRNLGVQTEPAIDVDVPGRLTRIWLGHDALAEPLDVGDVLRPEFVAQILERAREFAVHEVHAIELTEHCIGRDLPHRRGVTDVRCVRLY